MRPAAENVSLLRVTVSRRPPGGGNPKNQKPNPKQISNKQSQNLKHRTVPLNRVGHLELRILWDLEPGSWDSVRRLDFL